MPRLGQPTISIIVPVHGGAVHFPDCLRALHQLQPRPHEIIIVADGELSRVTNLAAATGAQVVQLPVAGGPARARNHGARAAVGEILFFVDSDVVVPIDVVNTVAMIFSDDHDPAAAIGSYDDEPGGDNFLSQYKNLLHHYVHQSAREEASTFWGACGAIRRETFLALDGFDESYRHPSIEDIELGYRLKQAGHKIRLVKRLQVRHLKRWSIRSLLASDLLHRALPWTKLILRHGRVMNDLNLRPASRVSAVIAWALMLSLGAAMWIPEGLGLAALLAILLLALNAQLYRFFYRKRGWVFTMQSIFWHWLYYLYSSAAFAVGTVWHLAGRTAGKSGLKNSIRPMERS
jgi:GT2 family glycosyltransferase